MKSKKILCKHISIFEYVFKIEYIKEKFVTHSGKISEQWLGDHIYAYRKSKHVEPSVNTITNLDSSFQNIKFSCLTYCSIELNSIESFILNVKWQIKGYLFDTNSSFSIIDD